MPEDKEFQRRLPSIYRKISDVKPEDIRICIIARIIDIQDNVVVLDDGTGQATAVFDEVSAKPDSLVRVFGRVIHKEKGFELQGEIIQDMENLDLEIYRKSLHCSKRHF